jgi:hypothetical protein
MAMRILTEMEQRQRDLVRLGTALTWLAQTSVLPMDDRPGWYGTSTDPAVNVALSRFRSPPSSWTELHRTAELRGDIEWTNIVDRLMEDPTAPLPT